MKEPKKDENSIERQKYHLHKKGYEDITKAISDLKETEKPEVQKVQILGLENLQGKEGPEGKQGETGPEGPMGSVEIKADGEVVKKADTIIINGFAGKEGPQGKQGPKGDTGAPGPKGEDGKPGKNGEDGSPDTPDEIVSKLQSVKKEWLDINAIKGDFNSRIRGNKVVGISSLKHLTDVDYSGLTQDANGNFILGSGSGGGITVQDIDGNPLVTDVTTIKFTNGAVTDDGGGVVSVTTGSGGGGDVSSSVASSVDSEVALFDGTGGKTIKRATGTGVAHLTSGVLSASNIVTADITDANVTLAKMADVATGTVFYRKTAATGVPEVQTLATLKTDLGLSGTNTGDQTSIVGITGTKAQFDTAVSDGNILYVGDITQYTDEMAQDAVGNLVGTGLSYNDGTGVISSTITQYTDELAQDAVGGMVSNSTFVDLAYVDGTPSLTASLSATGTPSASTYLRGDNTWATISGGGDVTKVGTPVNNQIGVWTGDGTIEGDASLTFDTSTDILSTVNITITGELTLPNTGLHILDTNGTHDLIIAPGSNLTADRTLTLTTGDTNMIVDFTAVTDEYVLAYDAGTNTWRGVVASGGGGGTPAGSTGEIQFNDGAGAFDADSNLFWDNTNKILNVGGGTITGYTPSSTTDAIWATKSTTSFFAGLNVQNTSNGSTSSSDIIAYNDAGTSYINMGIASSGNADPLFTSGQANSTYIYGYGEQLTIGTATSGKSLQFITGGTLISNVRATIDGNGWFSIFENSLTTTQSLTRGLLLENATAATVGAQKISPALRLSGKGWKTNATAASQDVSFLIDVLPVQGAAAPTGNLQISTSINGGSILKSAQFGSDGDFQTFIPASGLATFRVDSTGTLYISRTNSGAGKIYPSDVNGAYASGGNGIFVGMNTGFGGAATAFLTGITGNWANTTGNAKSVVAKASMAPTSGSGTVEAINIVGTINQTGGASGYWKGASVTPTLTAYADVRGYSMSVTSTISAALSPLLKGLDIQNTINHTGSVTGSNFTDIFINDVETSLTGTTHYFADWQISGATKFSVDNTGNVVSTGSYTSAAPSGGTAHAWKFGAVATVTPTSQNRTIEVEVNGTTYYLTAKTTND